MATMKFDPSKYTSVQDRIGMFLKACKAGEKDKAIRTSIAAHNEDYSFVIFKAEIWVDGNLESTGHAFENKGDGYVNKTSHIENCETSAIGRALANLGFHGGVRPSREEMQKVNKIQDNDVNDAIKKAFPGSK
jgi:hypothetical protein